MTFTSPELFVAGVSIHKTEAQVLADIAIPKHQLSTQLEKITNQCDLCDAVLLSTCNRTEIYFSATNPCNLAHEQIIKWLLSRCSSQNHCLEENIYYYKQKEAMEHLFKVVCGLDSMIIGETEISGQMQQAFEASLQTNQTSSFFKQLFSAAFRAGNRARSETSISAGNTSIASAAVHMAERITGDLAKRKVLVVGAGDTATKVCNHLNDKNAHITIANRTLEKARIIAERNKASFKDLSNLKELITCMDVIICAVSADTPVLTHSLFKDTNQKRKDLLHIIDLSMPMAVEKSIARMTDIFISDIGDLKRMVSINLSLRSKAQKQVEEIIEQEIKNFCLTQSTLELGPVISELRSSYEEIRRNEVKKHQNKFEPETFELIDQLTKGLINKLLHSPTVGIRDLANEHKQKKEKLQFVQKLFSLNSAPKKGGTNEN